MSKKTVLVAGIVAVGGIVVFATLGGSKQTPPTDSPREPLAPALEESRTVLHSEDASPPPVRLARPEPVRKPLDRPPLYKDEASLMAKLRDLGSTDLELSLRLAREGNERFPNSPDALERMWFVCKSLTGLGRSEEARAEALRMVQKYPGSSLTNDVQRHVLFAPKFDPPGP